ncbi:DUF2270 domain-containing protein [Deinococcus peraridilitoris]|uniref:Putative membrane protein n=1 Tax=Deinococcus peraridilitoris (strain DSM 19664 / LMG 22246 / CIP 109416 / KR-200) TaxID=937777 RepID=L0A1M0_DEIPD|nr:DUF2270 domain-containing protein [Deinococcus peraridilitoris]AFZ67726.1 putative membrane protein [Deinococcus peraridilitoris DSM 19664]
MSVPRPSTSPASSVQAPLSGNTANSLIHLYRAEVGRMTMYRVRLDTTTNWAVGITAGLLGFAFTPEGPHAALLAAMLANYFFLHVEARHFRDFEIAHLRVRILERNFYPSMLGQEVSSEWQSYFVRELQRPHVRPDRLQAIGWRLRHNYQWIFLGVLAAWLFKLELGTTGQPEDSFRLFVSMASLDFIPGALVFSLVLMFYLILFLLAVRAHSYPLEMD